MLHVHAVVYADTQVYVHDDDDDDDDILGICRHGSSKASRLAGRDWLSFRRSTVPPATPPARKHASMPACPPAHPHS